MTDTGRRGKTIDWSEESVSAHLDEALRLQRIIEGIREARRPGIEFMRARLGEVADPVKAAEMVLLIADFDREEGTS